MAPNFTAAAAPLAPEPLKGEPLGPRLRETLRNPFFLATWLIPLVVFAVIEIVYAFAFLKYPSGCVLLSICGAVGAGSLVAARHRGPLWSPLGAGTLLAVLSASVLGLYIFDHYAVFPQFYANSRIYTNVVPSQPSAAVADAGRIVFSADSAVDVARSVSFITESGDLFCLAPVRDNSEVPQVGFWVAGQGCCNAEGGFWCDAAGDGRAHSGIVVFDNYGFFGQTSKEPYEKAREKAEATYGLQSVAAPVYVRWVQDGQLDMLSRQYRQLTALWLTWTIAAFAVAAFLLAGTFFKPPPPAELSREL